MFNFIEDFVELHNKDIEHAKFKIGQKVIYKHRYRSGTGIITGVNNTGDEIEYSLDCFPSLLWENELKPNEE